MFEAVDRETLESIGAECYMDGLYYKNSRKFGESKKCHIERILDETRIRQLYELNGMYVIKTLYPKEPVFTKIDKETESSYDLLEGTSQWQYMFGK